MNVYKVSIDYKGYYAIDKDDYEQRTSRRSPWYKTSDTGSPQYFAICPACDNPIQIIGFYKPSINTPHPYGKHFGRSVPGVGVYDHEAYTWCPYSKKNINNPDERPKREPSYLTGQILKILICHFDKIVFFLSKNMGIRIDEKLAESMLLQYRDEEGWLYARATLMNVPWQFAYMTDNQVILFKKILSSDLAEILINQVPKYLMLNDNGYLIKHPDCKKYIELGTYYTRHHIHVQGNELVEKMDCVFTLKEGYNTPREIHRITIEFDYRYFDNLANFSQWTRSPYNNKLLQLANEILGPQLAKFK
ncbi:hypothetical protein [Xenorhabdus bovienii]|uniref:Uncharacterized protein n=2 Tax=Xenorhabdus bovienii TaxID=40576 RepID=A0A0B6XDM4_XENBV|nr:hypothetical protein [Xenorhabdus bovienii]MCG3463609.1 hypothetical protein [Xenorhabdus bovienii]MCG3469737.1 hypothetical protein [Xenorhabdus bovienii]CDG89513.1 conserved hypothetical protein [Xenorhabdus bovienii str. feltiae France]CDG92356.1 conserved hypothetical protein [Xenorhabdus bovienii str. feltiae Florida]CDG99760.1 conserved hypothetical protein [Xenorhabdus bovienii str. feltiae Moldova]